MTHEDDLRSLRLGRRAYLQFLGAAVSGTCLLHVPGCGFYEAESGLAFAPWDFPGPNAAPEVIAARAALLASSPHNTQPWALHVTPDAIELYADFARNLGAMDGLLRELHIGLGCALENLVIAARARGRSCDVALLPDASRPKLVARVRLQPAAAADTGLFGVIAKRHTNRGEYRGTPLAKGMGEGLQAQLRDEASSIRLHLLQSSAERARFRAETIAATEAIIADTAMSIASERWYRHSHAEIERYRDGITLDASGAGAVVRFVGKSVGRPSRAMADGYWLDATRGRHTTGSAFGILSSASASTRADQLRTGRVYQRMQLWATAHGLAIQPLNQMAERQDREQAQRLAPRFSDVLQQLMAADDARAQMLFRIGYPTEHALASPRRPLAWVQR